MVQYLGSRAPRPPGGCDPANQRPGGPCCRGLERLRTLGPPLRPAAGAPTPGLRMRPSVYEFPPSFIATGDLLVRTPTFQASASGPSTVPVGMARPALLRATFTGPLSIRSTTLSRPTLLGGFASTGGPSPQSPGPTRAPNSGVCRSALRAGLTWPQASWFRSTSSFSTQGFRIADNGEVTPAACRQPFIVWCHAASSIPWDHER